MPKIGCLGKILVALIVVLAPPLIGILFLPVPRPHISLPADVLFHIGSFPVTNTLITTWLSIILLIAVFYFATRKMKMLPRGLQNGAEIVIELLFKFVTGIAGEKNGRRFFPVIATIFLFVIANAWLALLPGFHSIGFGHHAVYEGAFAGSYDGFVSEVPLLRKSSTDINFPLAIALFTGVFGWFWGIRLIGFRKFFGEFLRFGTLIESFKQLVRGNFKPALGGLLPGIIDILVGFIEFLSHMIRVVSFTFRLFGNMTAGEALLLIIAFILPMFWVATIFFAGLELILGFVQALIFAGLTLVFVTMATTHEEDHK